MAARPARRERGASPLLPALPTWRVPARGWGPREVSRDHAVAPVARAAATGPRGATGAPNAGP
eukprot:2742842-Lingulodinium_polyedra.AAC.1